MTVTMNQSEFWAITSNLLKARDTKCVQVVRGFGFVSLNWREIFEPITKRSDCNRLISFHSHLKPTLMWLKGLGYPTEQEVAESTLAFTAERQVDS